MPWLHGPDSRGVVISDGLVEGLDGGARPGVVVDAFAATSEPMTLGTDVFELGVCPTSAFVYSWRTMAGFARLLVARPVSPAEHCMNRSM